MRKYSLFFFRRVFPVLIFFGILFFVIYFTPPPKTWQEASTTQILSFFLPLLAAFTFLVDLALNYLPRSFAIALALFLVVFFQALGILNLLTALLIAAGCVLLLKFIPAKRLTTTTKIPKLTKLGQAKTKKP